MYSQSRTARFLSAVVVALLLAPAPRAGAQEGAATDPRQLMCPAGGTLAAALAPYDALDKQRSKIDARISAAENSIQLFEQLKAEHLAGQRVWGVFQASDTSVALITAVLQTLKTKANLIRDLTADEFKKVPAIYGLSKVSYAIESLVQFGKGEQSDCDVANMGPAGDLAVDRFLPRGTGTAINLATNVCKLVEQQSRQQDVTRTHRRVMAQLEQELAALGKRLGSLRTQLAGVDSKRRGLERQCTEFTEQQRKLTDPRLADFIRTDAEQSRAINEQQLDARLQRDASAAASFDSTLQQMQS